MAPGGSPTLPPMRRWITIALLVCLGVVGIGRIRAALRSDSERLLYRIESMASGFDAGRVRTVLKGFDRRYRDEGSGAGRDDLRDALQYLFLTQHDRGRLTVELPKESLLVTFSEDGTQAEVVANPLFHVIRDDGTRELWWNTRVVADFVLDDGDWECVATREVNHLSRPR